MYEENGILDLATAVRTLSEAPLLGAQNERHEAIKELLALIQQKTHGMRFPQFPDEDDDVTLMPVGRKYPAEEEWSKELRDQHRRDGKTLDELVQILEQHVESMRYHFNEGTLTVLSLQCETARIMVRNVEMLAEDLTS